MMNRIDPCETNIGVGIVIMIETEKFVVTETVITKEGTSVDPDDIGKGLLVLVPDGPFLLHQVTMKTR